MKHVGTSKRQTHTLITFCETVDLRRISWALSRLPLPSQPRWTVSMCDGGIVGIQTSDVCCSASCGSCGGTGCSGRDGGSGACCGGGVRASGRYCSVTGEAPCMTVPMCDGGIVGIQASDVCCSASCGSCAGTGCSGRDGGSGACCGGGVQASGRYCSVTGEAPCMTGPAPTPEPTPAPTPPPTVEVPMCDGGIVGIQTSDVCCSASCGSCGGTGCSSRDGGSGACCGGGVRASGRYCSVTGEAPCMTGAAPTPEPTPAPTPPPTVEVPMCDGGIVGIQTSDVCCSTSCGSCGGTGCSGRDGGSGACCGGGVRASGRYCSVTGEAPCMTVPKCDGGIVGIQASDVCCSLSCESCGGSGCSGRDGGEDECCGGGVRASGRDCSVTGEAPCIVTSPEPSTPAPTPAPTRAAGTCDGGIVGVQASDVCCALSCGSCGGDGCSDRDGGEDNCCGVEIRTANLDCSVTGEAPCIVTSPEPSTPAPATPAPATPAPTPAPSRAAGTCEGGIVGVQASNVCCALSCGSCGGDGCSDRDGGEDNCCGVEIRTANLDCSVTGEAPCIVTSPEPSTPAPATPAPATPSPATPAPATPSPATPAPRYDGPHAGSFTCSGDVRGRNCRCPG
ncbi:hypothetical protein Esi_0531_0003 [Ectocarpus siliculosus]|uniref:Uncharacterized protein n=1 Tax=Ectocarpus siliculosus TaxID=2880 RepID=D7G3U7_ECTSI|nr:hypothetical protein Esi_0531_0003 [Ectocarpus siliculosus]|eukprot:CBJ33624.1 hypothetical protein Esi_0531_0003 [Ectocarpus siliculosus]